MFGLGTKPPALDVAQQTNAVRLTLLSRKYARALSAEQEARLQIATERINRLFARVTPEDFERLAETVERSEARRDRLRALEEELGL